MDPYCKLSTAHNSQEFRTETLDGAGKTPEWNETFTIEVSSMTDELKVEVHEADPINDDEIGQISIKLNELCDSAGIDEWYTIMYEGKSAGEVHLKTSWASASQPAVPVENMPNSSTKDLVPEANQPATDYNPVEDEDN